MRILRLILLAVVAAFAFADGAFAEEPNRNTVVGGDMRYWDELLRGRERQLQLIEGELLLYNREISRRITNLESMCEVVEIRGHQFAFALMTSTRSPYEFRLLCKDIYSLVTKSRREKVDSERMLEEIDTGLRQLSLMRGEIETLQSKGISPEMKETAGRIDKIIIDLESKLNVQREALATVLEKCNRLRDGWKEGFTKFEAGIANRLSAYFLNPEASVFAFDAWLYLPLSMKEWVVMLPFSISKKSPGAIRGWMDAVLCVLVGVTFFIFCNMILRRRLYPRLKIKPETERVFLSALLWASIAGGLFLSDLAIEFPGTVILTRLAVILVAKAGMDLAWGLRLTRIDADARSPLAPLFWLYAIGVVFQVLEVNSVILCFVWPLVLAAVFEWLRRHLACHYPVAIKRLLVMSLFLVALFWLISLAGYSMLSMFLSYILFISVLGVQFGVSAGVIAREIVANNRKRIGELPSAILLGIGIPLAWFAILGGATLWVADQFIELSVLYKLIGHKIILEGFVLSVPLLAAVVFMFFVCKTFISVMHTSVERYLSGLRLDTGSLPSLRRLITYAGWFAYFVLVLILFDVKLTSLAVVVGGLGVGIGIGLQNVVNNFVSGLLILFGRTVRPGDTIQIGQRWAKVVDVNIRNTVIKTSDNAIITVPNSNLISGELTNWTLNDPYFRAEIKVGVAYGADVATVERLLLEIAGADKRVLKTPEPRVLLSDLADSSMMFTLRIWFDVENDPYVQSDIRRKIVDVFEKNRIGIPYPQMDIHMRPGTA